MAYLVDSSDSSSQPARGARRGRRDHSGREVGERTDTELLLAVRAGDTEAYSELVERKTRPLLQVAFRMTGDREEAKDLVQMTLVRAWEHRHKFDERWSANTWLYRITTNLAIDFLRAKDTRRQKTEPVRNHLRSLHSRPDPGLQSLLGREVEAILRDLATGLSLRQRKAFWLREVVGLSSKEVARALGCRESTVRNHLFAARRKLRGELETRFPEYAALSRAARTAASERAAGPGSAGSAGSAGSEDSGGSPGAST